MPDMQEDVLRTPDEPEVPQVRAGHRCPPHILRAVEADLKRAKANAVPGQRIVRGTFVLFEIEALLDALNNRKDEP